MSYFTLIACFLHSIQDRDSNQAREYYIQKIDIFSVDEDRQNSWAVHMRLCSENESK